MNKVNFVYICDAMRAKTNIVTVVKDGKVLFVESNLKDFLKGFELMVDNAPHYNTLYNNLTKKGYYEKDGFYYQKFSAEQINNSVLSSANAATDK